MSETKQIAHAVANVKSVKLDGERMMRVIASSPTLDRDLEVIDTDSIQVPIRPKGLKYAVDLLPTDIVDLPFLIDHEWALEKQAGSVKSMFINADGDLEALVKLSTVDNGERVYTLAKEDHLGNSFSIGYSLMNATLEDGVYKNIELTELSAVFKGANRDARLLEVKSVKEIPMADATEEPKVEAPVAPQEEAVTPPEAPVVPEPKTETVEVPVAPVVEEKAAETEEVKEIEPKKEEVKETKTMSDTTKDIAVKSVVPMAELPKQETKATEKIDKVDFVAQQFVAWVSKDTKKLAELNQKALDSYKTQTGSKATYLNTGVTADGGAIVPSAELLADVYTLLDNYSTVSNDLRVITLTEGDSLDVATLLADVVMTEVETEGGTKPVTKPTFGDGNVALREFAGIAILTKKLVRQAAVNVYDIIRESFARAIANQRAVLALTDASSGIINKAGVVEVELGADAWASIRSMPYQLPTAAVPGAKYYISREMLEILDSAVDTTGRDLDIVTLDGDGLSGRFKNGFAFAVEENLGASTSHAVFGAMGRFGILLRQGTVESETFDQGTVIDGSSVTHNLIQQNKLAHRVAFYENVGYPLPGAFAVLVDEVS